MRIFYQRPREHDLRCLVGANMQCNVGTPHFSAHSSPGNMYSWGYSMKFQHSVVLIVLTLVLAACGPAAVEAQADVPTPTATASLVATPTATEPAPMPTDIETAPTSPTPTAVSEPTATSVPTPTPEQGTTPVPQMTFDAEPDSDDTDTDSDQPQDEPQDDIDSDQPQDEGPTPQPPIEELDRIFAEMAWQTRLDASFTDEACPVVPELNYAADRYQGRLIDTHLHMPQLPDYSLGFGDGERELQGFNETSFSNRDDFDVPLEGFPGSDQIPIAGDNITMNTIACTLQADGAEGGFAFYSVFTSQPDSVLDLAVETEKRWPGLLTPFISPPGQVNNVTTVGGARLEELLVAYPDLFRGLGEMRFNGSGKNSVDDLSHSELLSTFPAVQSRSMHVYLHPDNDQAIPLARVLADNPDINFIAHGDEFEGLVTGLMDSFPNLYYTIDALMGDQYLLHPDETAAGYLSQTDSYPWMLEYDLDFWKEAIESHPDQFMWGTDRGGIVLWGWDIEISRRLVDYARAFISQLDPAVQEKFAYQNAERLIQTGK